MNPRHVLPAHRERGPKRFSFTWEDIARGMGVKAATAKAATFLRKALAAADVGRFAALVVKGAIRQQARRLTSEEIASFLGKENLPRWERRFPRFELWWCALPGCREVLFAPGLCEAHGGGKPCLFFDVGGYVSVRVGAMGVALHKLIAQAPAGMHVHHKNGNKWDNRVGNLEPMDPDDHFDLHRRGVRGELLRSSEATEEAED